MSGVLSIPNQFANAVTATGLQLDTNYNTITAYINDPTNRNNYIADSGTTNTVVLTFSPPVVGGYTAGLSITFKAAAGNTGGVVINANGLGNASLFSPAGVALVGGEITAAQMVQAQYNGTAFYMTSASAASAVNQQAVAKAWAFVTATYGLATNYNVSSVSAGGTGTVTILFTTAMANANYAVASAAEGGNVVSNVLSRTTTSCVVRLSYSNSGIAIDTNFSFCIFGAQ